MGPVFKEFRQFILRGNLGDLAVAGVIGAAFTAVVKAVVSDFVTPLIAAVGGKHDFSHLAFTINGSRFLYGDLLNAIVTFFVVAVVVFYFVIRPMNKLMDLLAPEHAVDRPMRDCPECISSIPCAASRCPFCTSEVAAAA